MIGHEWVAATQQGACVSEAHAQTKQIPNKTKNVQSGTRHGVVFVHVIAPTLHFSYR